MDNGGAFIGFHFAGFALNNSDFPQNWNWYHNTFIGAGQYKSNTWHPTSAILRVEDSTHPVTKNLPITFKSSPNEWYRWEKDIRLNPDIKILLSIDSSSFPLGNGPKQSEIWHSGYYPVVWTNKNYKMLYVNMGHNDIDYDNRTNKELSFQFGNDIQDKMIIDGLIWLGTQKNSLNYFKLAISITNLYFTSLFKSLSYASLIFCIDIISISATIFFQRKNQASPVFQQCRRSWNQ